MLHRSHIYGVMGEFGTPEDLIHAVEKVREAGYRRLDASAASPGAWAVFVFSTGRRPSLIR